MKKFKVSLAKFLVFFVVVSLCMSSFSGISLVLAATPPVALSFSPLNNAGDIASTTTLTINFSTNIFAGAGNIYIKRLLDGSTFSTIAANSAQVAINGSVVTITPTPALEINTSYYVFIDNNAFKDQNNDAYDGISDRAAWNFSIRNDLFITEMVFDVNKIGAASGIAEPVLMNGIFYFQANDGVNGAELWRSDGTAGGTYMVKDINRGARGSLPAEITVMNNNLYFSATDEMNGMELWKSDGTAGGTVLIKDIIPGSNSSRPQKLVATTSTVYFSADYDLWKTDGTASGTILLASISDPASTSYPEHLTVMGGYVYFSSIYGANPGLWRSNGTRAGTTLVKSMNIQNNRSFRVMNNWLYFPGVTGAADEELWKSDGTTGGTTRVKDIYPSTNGSNPRLGQVLGNYLFFSATDNVNGSKLWKTDGTTASTTLVSVTGASSPEKFVVSNGFLYFSATNGVNGYELWRSNGTAGGTYLVKDINPGASDSSLSKMTVMNNNLYFSAVDGVNGREFWKSDGTLGGTVMVKDINSGADSSPSSMASVGSNLFFSADNGSNGAELWLSDGSGAGTSMLKDINTGTIGSSASDLAVYGGKLYFSANDGVNGKELWRSDGTAAGTIMVSDVYSGSSGSSPAYLKVAGSNLFFSASDLNSGNELWKYSTSSGLALVKDISLGTTNSSPKYLEALGSNVYFSATNGTNGLELWKSDGTSGGTTMVKDIYSGVSNSNPKYLKAMNGNIYFSASDATNGNEPWRSDGTDSGTVLLKDITVGVGDSGSRDYTALGNKLFFVANYQIWSSDGTTGGTSFFYNNSGRNMESASANDLFFSSNDIYGPLLYKSDGTVPGTAFLKNVGIGSTAQEPRNFTKLDGLIYFNANDPFSYGDRELWKTDKTASGTVIARDVRPGDGEADPVGLTVMDGALYFTADDGHYGTELFRSYNIKTPTSTTDSYSNVTASSSLLTGTVVAKGTFGSIERGFVYSSSPNPTISDARVSDQNISTVGAYSLAISSLSCSTNYHFRAYAKNKAGIGYGSDQSFTTVTCACPSVDNAATYNSYPACGPATCTSGYHVSGLICEVNTCSTLTGAVTYNAYPTCGAASCSSGYSLSGSGASATCASSGGSGGGGGSSGGSAIITPNPNTNSLIVTPSQGGNITKVFTGDNSVELIVPQNSVSSQTTFSVAESTLTSNNVPISSSGAFLVGDQAFNISAVNSSGQGVSSFSQPLTISIKIADLPATTADLAVYYFDEKTKSWVFVPGAVFNSINKTVTFTSNHLTLFAIFKMIGIKPSLAQTIKTDPVALITPVITEAENIVNRYYSLIDVNLEKQFSAKTTTLRNYNYLSDTEKDVIVKFVTYGTPSTKILGAGERLGVVNSYLSAFGRLPKTVADFNDVIKISTGHWPTATSLEAIANAKLSFKKIYLREADMNKPNDNAAVTITAYGLRSAKRNMNSEKAAIKIYKGIFKKAPTAATDWDTVRTIAYSGAKR